MKKGMFPKALVITLALAAVAMLMAIGSGTSQAGGGSHGDLVLDATTADNTDLSIGVVTRELCRVSAGSTVRIDVVADGAVDWAGMDWVVHFPSPSVLTRPGGGPTGDAKFTSLGQIAGDQSTFGDPDALPDPIPPVVVDPDAGFDFVAFDGTAATFGPNTLLSTAATSSVDYTLTQAPTGASPHGISVFDNKLIGESGDGGMARLSLDTTGLPNGEFTILLSNTTAFPGGVHTNTDLFDLDHYGAFKLAIGVGCSRDDDGDGVSNDDEATFGSDPADAGSIPESAAWIPSFNGPTCSDGLDNDGDGFTDEADIDCGPPAPAPFDLSMDLLGGLPSSLEISSPVTTQWHELFPNFSAIWSLDSFTDDPENTDGILSPSDVIDMTHLGADGMVGGGDDGPTIFFHVDEVTLTIFLDESGVKFERELVGAGGDAATMAAAIADPAGTFWHEVHPNLSELWHFNSITTDNGASGLDAGDEIDMTDLSAPGTLRNYTVDKVSMDILLTTVPEPAAIPACGTGIDLSGAAAQGIFNEIPPPDPSPFGVHDGSELLCQYVTTLSTPGHPSVTAIGFDACEVGAPCNIDQLIVIERPPSNPQVPQPAERAILAPSIQFITGPDLDFASDDEVSDGAVVGDLTVRIGSDLGIFAPECNSDVLLEPNPETGLGILLDATIDPSTTTATFGPVNPDSFEDLFSPFNWPLQLTVEQGAIEGAFQAAAGNPPLQVLTLHHRYVTSFDVVGDIEPDIPLNVLYWEVHPLVDLGLGAGGWVTVTFTGDPLVEKDFIPPLPSFFALLPPLPSDPTLNCTPFSVDSTILGESLPNPTFAVAGGQRLQTCTAASLGTPSIAVVDPNATNATTIPDQGTRIDISGCVLDGDVRVVKVTPNLNPLKIDLTALMDNSVPVTVHVQNQSAHTDTVGVEVLVIPPTGAGSGTCTINGQSGTTVVFSTHGDDQPGAVNRGDAAVLDPGHRSTFSGPDLSIVINCSVVPDGGLTQSFIIKACADHANDDALNVSPPPLGLDDDDIDPSDNCQSKTILVK